MRELPESLGARTSFKDVVGSCTIVELVKPGEESSYIVLYENKEPPGRPEAKKNGFPFGGIERDLDQGKTWHNAARELLEEAFQAAIPELRREIEKLNEELGISEAFGTTADSPETIRGKITELERKLEEAIDRAVKLFDTLAEHPEIKTCKRIIDRFDAIANDRQFSEDTENMKVRTLLEALVTEDDYVCEFTIRNERGFGVLHFIVFGIQMPMEVKLTPGDEQIEAQKLVADEIEKLNGYKEFFYHQYAAWVGYQATNLEKLIAAHHSETDEVLLKNPRTWLSENGLVINFKTKKEREAVAG